MSLDTALPDDVESLRRLLLAERQARAEQAEELRRARAGLVEKTLELEKLKMQLAKLRRMSFGRSSEKLDRQIEQLELMLGDLEAGIAQSEQKVPDRPMPESPMGAAATPGKRVGRPEKLTPFRLGELTPLRTRGGPDGESCSG